MSPLSTPPEDDDRAPAEATTTEPATAEHLLDDEESLRRFLAGVRPKVQHLLARFRIPPEDGEDLVQQTLLTLLYKAEQVHTPEAWLMGTLRNKCLLYWRKQRRSLYDTIDQTLLEWTAGTDSAPQEHGDLRRDLTGLIAQLPERCRSILMLRYTLGYGSQEVAEALGYRSSSIRKVAARCLAALEDQLLESGYKASSKSSS